MFGANILHKGVKRWPMTRFFMASNNMKGIFSNKQDSLDDMKSEIAKRFDKHEVENHGVVVLCNCHHANVGAISTAVYTALNRK